MQTIFNHVQFNIDPANVGFYRDLFAFLEWKTCYEDSGSIGVIDRTECSLWFMGGVNDSTNDHDGPGFNHLGIGAATLEQVDAAAEFLHARGVELLYGTPCHRPEYAHETGVYYSAMFESPDRILLEIVYTGPHTV